MTHVYVSPNKGVDQFFAKLAKQDLMVTYDDVRLHTCFSNVMPSEVDLTTYFSRRIKLRMPIVSAAMDTVTTAPLAIALASCGGIGIIHKNMTPEEQAAEVQRVKLHLNGLIANPICVEADATIADVLAMRAERGFSFYSFPVISDGKLVGLLTPQDFDLEPDQSVCVREVMTPRENLITASIGATIDTAYDRMRHEKIKILPLVDTDGAIAGLYIRSDIRRIRLSESMHNVDSKGHLRVAAAIGVGENALTRAELLASKGCDAFVIDTAHGYSENVFTTIESLKRLYPDIDIVAGNVSRGIAAKYLADAGADGVIVGQGGGSICTTRIVAGIGCPQVSAVYDAVLALRGTGIPVIADGGIRNSGDIVIALAIGASSVILGRGLAGTKEAPGEVVVRNGLQMKQYRGMASEAALRANEGSRERYRQGKKLVPEGVESLIPYAGTTREVLESFIGGVQAGFGYLGASTMDELVKNAIPFRMTAGGLQESHPHDVLIAVESPNYHRS